MKKKANDFEKIYQETYYSTLKFIAIKCNNIEDINDILQDTYFEFLKILNSKSNLIIENYNSYLDGIASNIIKRHYSKMKKISTLTILQNEDDIQIADDFNMENEFIIKENAENVWEYIKNKDLITGKIFYLYFIFDMKISDIAIELDLNESTVKNRIYRTLKELKKYLGEEEQNDE